MTDGRGWLLVHPRGARDRTEDLDEVREMIEAGELDIAIDELHWLLSGCSELIEAHLLLGELALAADDDVPLARGHFGAAYQLGVTALRRAGMPSPLPYSHPANKAFFEAGRALAWCLAKLDKLSMAEEIVEVLLKLDPTDPLRLRAMLDDLRTGGLPIVELRPAGEDAAGEPPPVG
jgi:tetratricopeptide (TPR) repeat protein